MITIYTSGEIEKIAAAGKLTADTLSMLEKAVVPGISTGELDEMAEKFIRDRGGIPSCKGYEGFPATICASVNDAVVHGIPSPRKILKKGDIISLDLVVELNGYMGDSCITVPVGHINKKNAQLLKVTEEALFAGISQAVPGNTVGDIGHAVESYVKPYGYDVLRDYVGHGIGTDMHEDPEIPNYGTPGHGPRLEEGMVICIEPMVTMGKANTITLRDGWSVLTADGLPACHFEHTLVITKTGPKILTLRD